MLELSIDSVILAASHEDLFWIQGVDLKRGFKVTLWPSVEQLKQIIEKASEYIADK